MKKLIAALVLSLSLVISAAAPAKDIPPEIIEFAEANVWSVAVQKGSATGFFIDDETMLTACHVVEKTEDGLVLAKNDISTKMLELEVKSCNKATDIAILKLITGPYRDAPNPMPVCLETPKYGDEVFGAGYGMNSPMFFTVGHWGRQINPQHYMATADTVPGDSGSPLLHLVDGEVCIGGMRQFVATQSHYGGMAIVRELITHLVGIMPAHKLKEEL